MKLVVYSQCMGLWVLEPPYHLGIKHRLNIPIDLSKSRSQFLTAAEKELFTFSFPHSFKEKRDERIKCRKAWFNHDLSSRLSRNMLSIWPCHSFKRAWHYLGFSTGNCANEKGRRRFRARNHTNYCIILFEFKKIPGKRLH